MATVGVKGLGRPSSNQRIGLGLTYTVADRSEASLSSCFLRCAVSTCLFDIDT